VQDQRWHIELFQVFGEVGFGKGFDAKIRGREAAIMPCSQKESRTPWEIFAPGRL